MLSDIGTVDHKANKNYIYLLDTYPIKTNKVVIKTKRDHNPPKKTRSQARRKVLISIGYVET